MFPTAFIVDLSDRDNNETLLVKEEETNDTGVFGEVEMDVVGSQKEPLLGCRADRPIRYYKTLRYWSSSQKRKF